MRKYLMILSTGCLALAGCSSADESEYAASESADYAVAEEAADAAASGQMRAPGISPTAAPGVAFNYRYAFRVPDAKIAGVQEVHASACEALGISRCRITGMRFRLVKEDQVEAFLSFKLDPIIARKFGKDAISSVEKAEGILVDSEISGVDVGSKITASQRRSSDLGAELKRIENRLTVKGLGDRERSELQEQAQRLRSQLQGEKEGRRQGEASLATTPMQFSYSGGEGIPSFARGNPLANALDTSISGFIGMAGYIIIIIGALLPWLILTFLLVLLWRSPYMRKVRGWFTRQSELAKPEE